MRRTKAEAQETREAILDAALCVFNQRGVSRTSLEEIAKAAGVTRGAIYWHFRNKADLFEELHKAAVLPMQDILYRLVENENGDPLERLEEFCIESFIRLQHDQNLRRTFTVLLLRCEASGEMASLLDRLQASKEQSTARLTSFFAQQQESGALNCDAKPRILALSLHDYMTGLFTGYLRSPSSYSMPEDARQLVHHFFAPLRSRTAS